MIIKWCKNIKSLIVLLLISNVALAQDFPSKNWHESVDELASTNAIKGGALSIFAGQSPKSFNYYLDTNSLTAQIFGFMFETLLGANSVTMHDEPNIASKWQISPDKLTFKFWIDPAAKWSDGQPITASDVLFTYDTILNPKNMTGPHKVGLERFKRPVIINDSQIVFTAKTIHWSNLSVLGGLQILPKHILANKDFNKINFEFPVVSGPYKLGTHNETISLTMERNQQWWAQNKMSNRYKYNFDKLIFKFYADRNNAFEAFKKGDIDLFAVYTAKRWVKDAVGKSFDKNWIIKQRIYNFKPVGFQGFAMNMRREPFNNLKLRKALSLLLNREKMNTQLMYSQYFMLNSYYPDIYDLKHKNSNKKIVFNKSLARKLLKEAGWVVNPATGLQEKDKKPLVIKFLTRDASANRFLAIYREDLADVGIQLKIIQKDWASWAKDMDSYNFDMTWAAWGAGIRKNPEAMWHSKEINRPSGINITGFKNTQVDTLINKQMGIFDMDKRHEICRQIDKIVYSQYPYALLWMNSYTRLLYWNKFGTPKTVLSKYGGESSAYVYWWFDEDNLLDLKDAQADDEALPDMPLDVVFPMCAKDTLSNR